MSRMSATRRTKEDLRSTAGVPRGMTQGLLNETIANLEQAAKRVCRNTEVIPLDDFLSLIYSAEAKAQWYKTFELAGPDFLTSGISGLRVIEGMVRPTKSDKAFRLYFNIDQNDLAGSSPMFIELWNTKDWRPLLFTTLDWIDSAENSEENCKLPNGLWAQYVPRHAKPLHTIYGRNIVRAAREFMLFEVALEKVRYLFERADCTREVKHFFPELVKWIPVNHDERDHLKRTRTNKFSSRFKIALQEEDVFLGALGGDKWDIYKKHIISLMARADLIRSLYNGPTVVGGDDRLKFREALRAGSKDIHDVKIRVSFSP